MLMFTMPYPLLSPTYAAILFASSYVPLIGVYLAPYERACAIFAISMSLGAKT